MNNFIRFASVVSFIMFSSTLAHADSPVNTLVEQFNQLIVDSKQNPQTTPQAPSSIEDFLNLEDSNNSLNPYIFGGNNASRNEYPEYALVLITDAAATQFVGSCGGTMIAPNKVLTAAHCSQLAAYRYYVVPNFYSFNDSTTSNDFYQASSIIDHPSYNSTTSDYDIGIITLARSASFDVASIHKGSNQLSGSAGTVIGTGATMTTPDFDFSDILQEVSAPITSNEACNDIWQELGGISNAITNTMMCAGFTNNGNGSCVGDSGGPLWVTIKGVRTLVGSVSFGFGVCEENRATQAYARLSEMTDFIESQSPQTSFIVSNDTIIITPVISLLLDN